MVLQDKYKARASARYRAAHGMAPKERGPGRGRGRGRAARNPGPGRGEGTSRAKGADASNDEDKDEDEDEEEEEGEEEDAQFPTLRAAAEHASKTDEQRARDAAEAEAAAAEARRYARRPKQSNAWRFEQLMADSAPKDPRLAVQREGGGEEGEEEEPEEDLTELLAKVKQLDVSKGAVTDGVFARAASASAAPAVDSEERARRRREMEDDIDHDLDYLKARAQARAQAQRKHPARADALAHAPPKALSKDEVQRELALLAEIDEKRQHAEHLRSLKARFTGRSLGERATQGRTLNLAPVSGRCAGTNSGAGTGTSTSTSTSTGTGSSGAVTGGTIHGGIDKRSIGSAGQGAAPRAQPTPTPTPNGPIKIEDAEDFLDSIL